MALQDSELQQQLSALLGLTESEAKQIITHADSLPQSEGSEYLSDLLGDSPEALRFITAFRERHANVNGGVANQNASQALPSYSPPSKDYSHIDSKTAPADEDVKTPFTTNGGNMAGTTRPSDNPPSYAPPPGLPPALTSGSNRAAARHHTNAVIEAGKLRARDEVRSNISHVIARNNAANSPTARNAANAPEPSISIRHLQQRRGARARSGLLLRLPYSPVPKCQVPSVWCARTVVQSRDVPGRESLQR